MRINGEQPNRYINIFNNENNIPLKCIAMFLTDFLPLLSIAKVVGRLEQPGSSAEAAAVNDLMQTLGVQEQDKQLLHFWSTAANGR